MGTRLQFCTAFHPHLDGQNERTSQTLEIILRVYVLGVGDSWDTYLPLAGFRASLAIMPHRDCAEDEGKHRDDLRAVMDRPETSKKLYRQAKVGFRYHRGKEYSDSERGASSALVTMCVGKVAYRTELPSELSQLRKCLAEESVHIPTNSVLVDENTECRVGRETKTLQNKKIGLVKAHLEYRKGVKKIEKGLRALCHLVKLVMISTVRSAFDHRGSIVVAFLTQGFPGEFGRKWDSLNVSKLMVPPGRLKGRAWLEVPISREAQFHVLGCYMDEEVGEKPVEVATVGEETQDEMVSGSTPAILTTEEIPSQIVGSAEGVSMEASGGDAGIVGSNLPPSS
ncbi:LOW QUALITY PROTEIN: hypothetical protein OSB04_015977 [Centaurea solstitialis]|uniref:Uncharacterized protein n=1 Tax=Centaurea solstitialis TaxID=347529 RepID=A0AA38W809_9ASTR|nr:LOW QUALITY PROTEIN: hypothetical protein OSB04_015977 [Centaurea solstitialis]